MSTPDHPGVPPAAPHMTPDAFRAAGHAMIDWIADYWAGVERYPVLSTARPDDLLAALPAAAPERGEAWEAIAADVDRLILPGITHWQSPNFFAFFPANASAPAVLGELLSAGLGVNGMLWATSPAATELETRMLDWLADMLDLPARFRSTSPAGGGVIQGTASESTLVAMLAARHRALTRSPGADLVAYTSTQAHSSVIKAAMIAGLATGPEDRGHLRLIDPDAGLAMRPDLLAAAMREDAAAGRTPFYVCATVGTTSSTAIDPLERIGPVCQGAGAWLHVDAAHAGAACICPEYRPMLRGVEHADSLCFNPHKWLLTNFDCDLFWTADRAALTGALSITPEYLRNAASEGGMGEPRVVDYRDWQVPLGRRFRALKLWFVVRHYGVEGLRAHIREHMRLAGLFEGLVRDEGPGAGPGIELAAPRTMNLVCFRLRGEGPGADDRNRRLLERINATGEAYLSHTVLPTADGGGRYVLRMAIGGTMTRERHVRRAWDVIREQAAAVSA